MFKHSISQYITVYHCVLAKHNLLVHVTQNVYNIYMVQYYSLHKHCLSIFFKTCVNMHSDRSASDESVSMMLMLMILLTL